VLHLTNGFDVVLTFKRIHLGIAVEVNGTNLELNLEPNLEPVSSLVQAGARIVRFLAPCLLLDAHEGLPKPLFMPLCDTQRLGVACSMPAGLLEMNSS
jgi:hypothetical protein